MIEKQQQQMALNVLNPRRREGQRHELIDSIFTVITEVRESHNKSVGRKNKRFRWWLVVHEQQWRRAKEDIEGMEYINTKNI